MKVHATKKVERTAQERALSVKALATATLVRASSAKARFLHNETLFQTRQDGKSSPVKTNAPEASAWASSAKAHVFGNHS